MSIELLKNDKKGYQTLVMFRDEKILTQRIKGKGSMEYFFKGIPKIPNIPFYMFLFEDGFYPKYLNEIKEKDGWGDVKRRDTLILRDDDCKGIEKRALNEFIKIALKAKRVGVIYQYEIIGGGLKEYVSVSRSCRLITITYCNGEDIYQRFIPNKELTHDEMKKEIKMVHMNAYKERVPIFFNGENFKEFGEIGTIVKKERLFKLAEEMDIRDGNKI